ncbi:hypothetical protein [Brevundimonas nasdae]|uniref:Uncharacterized protein n=1 Tax=Brevundimonas nasdae TaxID=172043 RepID=A0ABX8TME4_9CAUL|nr:hypothetical protein [Brevundimonas nasdae]QYC12410.1 hypothetical protein KWG56_18375 [Brevundimonas nasdae]
MQFKRTVRHPEWQSTTRKESAYRRSCQRKQDALPLLAPLIAEKQRPVEEEFERRRVASLEWEASRRRQIASDWRAVRRRLFDLPDYARKAVVDRYHSSRWFPREARILYALLWSELRAVSVRPEDMPAMDAAGRLAECQRFNDMARRGGLDAAQVRARYAYSPGAMAFLAPGFQPTEDASEPHLYLHTSRGRWSILFDRVRAFEDFNHNCDPSGERRSGVFEALGSRFRFEVLSLNHCDDEPAAVAWNIDLSRRWVWIGLEDETPNLDQATISDGWCWRPRPPVR